MDNSNRLSLSKESRILLLISGLDLLSTIWLISTGRAEEGNPVMSFYLHEGWLLLIIVKLTLSLLPIFILEWCRSYKPRFVQNMLRLAIAAYLGLYLVNFIHTNILDVSDEVFLDVQNGASWSEQVESVPGSDSSMPNNYRKQEKALSGRPGH